MTLQIIKNSKTSEKIKYKKKILPSSLTMMTFIGLTELANFLLTRPTPNFFMNSSKFSVFNNLYLPTMGSAAGGGRTSIMADLESSS